MRVRPYEHGRYLVTSETDPDLDYLVEIFPDLKCSCPDFAIRVEARHEKKECKHLRCVYVSFGRMMAQQIREQTQPKRSPFAPQLTG